VSYSLIIFLRAKVATALARLSHRNSVSVRLSITWVDQSKMVQVRITWNTLVSGSVKLFDEFERGHPEQGC